GALHVHAELGREHHLVALALEGVAHERFALPSLTPVDVSAIEQSHPRVDCGVDDGVGALLRLSDGSDAAEVVAAEADRGDAKTRRAEVAVLNGGHGPTLAGAPPQSLSPGGSAQLVRLRARQGEPRRYRVGMRIPPAPSPFLLRMPSPIG